MMEQDDITLLNAMRQAIVTYRSDTTDVGRLADRLLALRDGLQLKDPAWSHELTQHIATLDSASTFVPENNGQASQVRAATTAATDGLLQLIEAQMGSIQGLAPSPPKIKPGDHGPTAA